MINSNGPTVCSHPRLFSDKLLCRRARCETQGRSGQTAGWVSSSNTWAIFGARFMRYWWDATWESFWNLLWFCTFFLKPDPCTRMNGTWFLNQGTASHPVENEAPFQLGLLLSPRKTRHLDRAATGMKGSYSISKRLMNSHMGQSFSLKSPTYIFVGVAHHHVMVGHTSEKFWLA